jgi:hypothetical protein
MVHQVARDGGTTEAGHYVVGYAVEEAEACMNGPATGSNGAIRTAPTFTWR